MRRKKEVTLQNIADELDLTIHTVSKALRGLPGMSETTRADVIETARRLGYRTKEQEISNWYEKIPKLLTNRKRFMFLLTADTPFFRLQLAGLQERLQEYGHIVTVSYFPSDIQNRDSYEAWVNGSDLLYYDGLFIPPAIPASIEPLLLALPIPKVLINYPPPLAEVDSVIWDVEHAIRLSVQHLLDQGHRHLLYVGAITGQRGFGLRWSAFQDAMRQFGLDAEPKAHITDSRSNMESWEEEIREKLFNGRCTAILCAIDHDLKPLLLYLQAKGKTIPTNFSLIGLESVDSLNIHSRLSRPALLVREAGRRAAEKLLWRIANPHEPFEHIRLTGGFIDGDTVIRL